MAAGERSLEGWMPAPGDGLDLPAIVDLAFDYRGDVTVVRVDGTRLVGYLYNRNGHAAVPYLQVFDPGGDSHTLRYAEVATIHFTGADTAAGKSYEAWLRRRTETASLPGA
jgi:hypothetical protein